MAIAGSDLNTVLRNLQKYSNKIRTRGTFIEEVVKPKEKDYILGRIQERLYRYGVDGDGKKLPPYPPNYEIWKRKKMGRGKPTSLYLTGAWYDSMYVRYGEAGRRWRIEVRTYANAPTGAGRTKNKGQFNLKGLMKQGGNNADKTRSILRKYGEAVLQLTEPEQVVLASYVEQQIINELNTMNIKMKFK